MRAVNLLPREETRQRKQLALTPQNTPVVVGAGLGVVIIGALALGYQHEAGAVASARQELQQKKVELAATPKPPPPAAVQVDPNAQLPAEQSARLAAVTTALGARFAWDRVLRELAQVLPDDVWLGSLTFQTPQAGTGAPPGTGITLVGTTYSHNSVARLLARLALVPELSDVSLQSDAAGGSSGSDASSTPAPAPAGTGATPGTVTFTITATVNLPPGATSLTPAPPPPPPPAPTSTDSSGATS